MPRLKPKFQVGDYVSNKVSKKGSYEPSICNPYTRLEINAIRKSGNTFVYTCGFDGYEFTEDELLSPNEYVEIITAKEGFL